MELFCRVLPRGFDDGIDGILFSVFQRKGWWTRQKCSGW